MLGTPSWLMMVPEDVKVVVLVSSDCLTITAQGVGMLTVITFSFICLFVIQHVDWKCWALFFFSCMWQWVRDKRARSSAHFSSTVEKCIHLIPLGLSSVVRRCTQSVTMSDSGFYSKNLPLWSMLIFPVYAIKGLFKVKKFIYSCLCHYHIT